MIDRTPLTSDDLIRFLDEKDPIKVKNLLTKAYNIKVKNIGSRVFLRGIIELSNICSKNCYYCGLRQSNHNVERYELSQEQVLEAAMFAWKAKYGSLVLQAGERTGVGYTAKITELVRKIKDLSNGELGITLSLGEQSKEIYQEWFDAGAHRYLLRIESSNPDLYNKIHPKNSHHSWEKRVKALYNLKDVGYQTGTGVMIGLPFQTSKDLADDLLFMKEIGIHMVGMGPYLRHSETPLGKMSDENQGLELTLKMVALLRILMPKINIAATTAMQVIDPEGREKAVLSGANIIMPNMTVSEVRQNYQIYENKPGIEDDAAISKSKLEENLKKNNIEIGWSEWGDSLAFIRAL
ncbi:MAG: [FeFe] hydrogenase H-cluster radical SAM maturase HydE [Bacteroidales bacterium]